MSSYAAHQYMSSENPDRGGCAHYTIRDIEDLEDLYRTPITTVFDMVIRRTIIGRDM
jgi:hypothetical protein